MSTGTPVAWSARRGRPTCSSGWLFDRRELRDLGASVFQAGGTRGGIQFDLDVVRLVGTRHGFGLLPVGVVRSFELVRVHAGTAAVENGGQLFGREVGNADVDFDGFGAIVRGLVRTADRVRDHAHSPVT